MVLTAEHHDAGFIELPLRYRRGSPPPGYPETIQLHALNCLQSSKVLEEVAKVAEENRAVMTVFLLLLNSLPAPWNTESFLDRLTVGCFSELSFIAQQFAFGFPDEDGLKKKVPTMDSDVSAPAAGSPALELPVLQKA